MALADAHLDAALAALDRVPLVPGPEERARRHRQLRDRARPMTLSCLPIRRSPKAPTAAGRVTVRRRGDRAGTQPPRASSDRCRPQERQHEDGWWKGELETNVTMDAEDLLLRQFLGIRTEAPDAAAARWIRSRQRDDGTWATFYGGPPDLSTTIEAYVALRLAGDDARRRRTCSGRGVHPRSAGGIGASRVFTRIWLALFGLWPWESLPVLPPELVLLPPWVPLNIYDFGCWARQTVVALTVVTPTARCASSPSASTSSTSDRLPAARTLARARGRVGSTSSTGSCTSTSAGRSRLLRRFSLGQAERWILKRQEADGSWGGIQPPWVYSLIALHLQGYAARPPGHAGRRWTASTASPSTTRPGGGSRRASPRSGTPRWRSSRWPTPACVPTTRRSARPGRGWSTRRSPSRATGACAGRNCAPGGWAFEFANDNYPDIDDTAEVVLALRRTAEVADGGAVARAVDVDGGDAVPGRRMGRLRRRQHADALPRAPVLRLRRAHRPAQRRRHRARRRDARPSWAGAAGRPSAASLAARRPGGRRLLVRPLGRQPRLRHRRRRPGAGRGRRVARTTPAIRRAVAWLEAHQNDDGGWGEDLRSYAIRTFGVVATSTACQTAWALLALWRGGRAPGRPARGASASSSTTSCPTGPGTSPGSPAPASPATSTSTTTSTGWSSR